jgi:hypothetical protein
MTMFDLYRAMLAESERRRLPRQFPTDLTVHDAAFIRQKPLATFAWLLYAGGTHVVRLSDPGGARAGIASVQSLFASLAAEGVVRLYLATPMSLTECRPDELEDLLSGRAAA